MNDGGAEGAGRPLAIYIHWPFCRSKCPYCDFNSHVRESVDQARWLGAYLTELTGYAEETVGRPIGSVFFGGGTPSLMEPRTAAAVLDRIASLWPLAAGLEVTLEANPSTAEAERFRALREAGVNRLSIGVQALDDAALRFLGRGHSAAEARAAVVLAGAVFARFSFDLIWGRPGQSETAWRQELRAAAAMAGDHLSAYQLGVEPGTAFFRDGVPGIGEDESVGLFEATQEVLSAAGLPAYEVSNHAREGAQCGAHGRLTCDGCTVATRAIKSPEKWLARVEERGSGLAERVPLAAADRREELILLGLRLTSGIERRRFRALTGIAPEDAVDAAALGDLVDLRLLECDEAGLRTTPAGRLRLNAVLARLLA